ncbi:MAG: hypothetical protein U1E42_10305 [Rhodospirillales bacterium]
MATTLTQADVEAFAAEWYRRLDEHVPVEQVVAMVAPGEVEFRLPEATLVTAQQVGQWYAGGGSFAGVINVFFDEVHTLRSVVAAPPAGDRVQVDVVVNWQARIWRPPAARSERLAFDATQRWELVPAVDGRPLIARYLVDALTQV